MHFSFWSNWAERTLNLKASIYSHVISGTFKLQGVSIRKHFHGTFLVHSGLATFQMLNFDKYPSEIFMSTWSSDRVLREESPTTSICWGGQSSNGDRNERSIYLNISTPEPNKKCKLCDGPWGWVMSKQYTIQLYRIHNCGKVTFWYCKRAKMTCKMQTATLEEQSQEELFVLKTVNNVNVKP